MSSPEEKRKTETMPTKESTPTPSLPHDLLLSCIARVSRLYYPTLSLVSKSFRSLVASPELYQTRSLLGHTESCLYVCFGCPSDSDLRWFTLCRMSDRTRKKKSSGHLLVPIPSPPSPSKLVADLVAVDSNIYIFGGDVDVPYSSRVSVLDCKSHTWNQAPSMHMERSILSTASLVDGKIYVVGGCEDRNFVNWVEAFDPKTQTWSSILSPVADIRDGAFVKGLGHKGKYYLFGIRWDMRVAYNPKEGIWNRLRFRGIPDCVIDNVFFILNHEKELYWLDPKGIYWRRLEGDVVLPSSCDSERCKMAECGGKMVLLWDKCDGEQDNMIWCAEISLERRVGDKNDEIWGKVEWCDVVLTVPKICNLWNLDALSVIV